VPTLRIFQGQIDKGLPRTAANAIVAGKPARIAFSLIHNQIRFVKKPETQLACVPQNPLRMHPGFMQFCMAGIAVVTTFQDGLSP